jgi:hypothetical protein
MVHIPDDDSQAPEQPQKRPASKPAQRPVPQQGQRPPNPQQARRPQTGEAKRPPTDQSKRPPTGQNRAAPDRKKTGPVGEKGGQRRTQMLSLEPPRRNRGPALGNRDARLDGMAGPNTISSRHRSLMGNIGRDKPQQAPPPKPKGPPDLSKRPTVRKGDGAPMDLGGSEADMVVRRKPTRRIPKPGGGFQGEASALDSLGSGRRPSVDPRQQQRPQQQRPQGADLPPMVNMPVPAAPRAKPDNPPPSSRGNTLAGVSAEELLGEEGRQLLEQMRKREQDTSQQPQAPPQSGMYREAQPSQPKGPPLQPRPQDSSRMAFQSAEHFAEEALEEVKSDDELRPQGEFLQGPTRVMQRDVIQTPQPVDQDPPPDDLGYELPVNYGDESGVVEDYSDDADDELGARESAAHDELEQRAGYLLWLQGVITREEVEDALTNDDGVDDAVRTMLETSAFADQISLYRFLARHESLEPIDLEEIRPSERALASLRPAIARAYRVVPVEKVGGLLLVAAAFPFDPSRLLELRRLTSSKVKLFVATEEEIDNALAAYYPPASAATLRSPKPVADDQADDEEDPSAITGEGEALEANYDPTLPGSDSGLYQPIDGDMTDNGVEMEELDDGFDAELDTDSHSMPGDASDLDESTLSKGGDKLRLSGDEQDSNIETGPEDLDPFGE